MTATASVRPNPDEQQSDVCQSVALNAPFYNVYRRDRFNLAVAVRWLRLFYNIVTITCLAFFSAVSLPGLASVIIIRRCSTFLNFSKPNC